LRIERHVRNKVWYQPKSVDLLDGGVDERGVDPNGLRNTTVLDHLGQDVHLRRVLVGVGAQPLVLGELGVGMVAHLPASVGLGEFGERTVTASFDLISK
jgi:hypothetical protein